MTKQQIQFTIASAIMLVGFFILCDIKPALQPDFIQRHNTIYGLVFVVISVAWFRLRVFPPNKNKNSDEAGDAQNGPND